MVQKPLRVQRYNKKMTYANLYAIFCEIKKYQPVFMLAAAAGNFNCLQFVISSFAPSACKRFLRTAQYTVAPRALDCSVNTPTTSVTEKKNFEGTDTATPSHLEI